MKTNKREEITIYDNFDTTEFIDKKKHKTLVSLGIKLPKEQPTKIVSIRLPTVLYNEIKAFSTNHDMSYQTYIKYLLAKGIKKEKA